MVLSTEWSQVEVIDLVNDGSGLGFGIVGGKSTGVVIKSILPGGIADKDNRLQSGDHILQIGDVNLRGLAADQVATVLRQTGQEVRMVVARPVEPSSADFHNLDFSAPIVPTRILTDPEELDRTLLQNGFSAFCNYNRKYSCIEDEEDIHYNSSVEVETLNGINDIEHETAVTINNTRNQNCISPDSIKTLTHAPIELEYTLPENEKFSVELNKNEYGLGITVAGYVCEREDLSGIFVKSLSECSEAFKCRKIQLNDRIIEVDGESIESCSNHEAVEKLKKTGDIVKLTFERFLRGPKFEHLREALASQEENDLSPPSPSVTTLSWIPIENNEGPVGQNGKLCSGDELLEVNGQKLLGIRHVEVVKLLKELPSTVRLVCARKNKNRVINTSQDIEGFEARNILGGSLKNLLPHPEQRLLKALSDTSINTSSTLTVSDDLNLTREKSRSMEDSNIAMWKDEVEYIELTKNDRGFGFSILDYQDPIDPKSTVIVVRSLVPKGVAEQDGRITPGDKLVSVNNKSIINVPLDEAVQALKCTVPGPVRLGFCKPVPRSGLSGSDSAQNTSKS
ncbi:patj homolog isoform X3 [Harmonia axyridis]|uniref:patj homolog isoform X3 n=1 Tax=Harmonia axyridis TaxID=115357 RepID=UPI001E277B03|nr:patj homolog isoform X3 [Harmonia axyridis]